MRRNTNYAVKLFALSLPVLMFGVSTVKAQAAPKTGKGSVRGKAVLNGRYQELLARYGPPTAVCFLSSGSPNPLFLPEGVPIFLPKKAPTWAQSALFSLNGSENNTIWLYKKHSVVVSYLVDCLGYVSASCATGQVEVTAASWQVLEATPLPGATLGDDMRRVIFKCGYPDEVRQVSAAVKELVYWSREKRKGYDPVYATAFTIRDNRVVRVYSFEDFSPFGQPGEKNYRLIGRS